MTPQPSTPERDFNYCLVNSILRDCVGSHRANVSKSLLLLSAPLRSSPFLSAPLRLWRRDETRIDMLHLNQTIWITVVVHRHHSAMNWNRWRSYQIIPKGFVYDCANQSRTPDSMNSKRFTPNCSAINQTAEAIGIGLASDRLEIITATIAKVESCLRLLNRSNHEATKRWITTFFSPAFEEEWWVHFR